jgi:hypothetical protein
MCRYGSENEKALAQPAAWSGRGMARPVCISTAWAPRRSGRAFGDSVRSMMFKHPFTVTISVDSQARALDVFWHHFQDHPYPGGHRYEVVYHSDFARKLFSDFPSKVTRRLDRSTATWFLHYVYFSLGERKSEQPIEFVLNTIDSVETSDDTVRIAGECSPFVRELRK